MLHIFVTGNFLLSVSIFIFNGRNFSIGDSGSCCTKLGEVTLPYEYLIYLVIAFFKCLEYILECKGSLTHLCCRKRKEIYLVLFKIQFFRIFDVCHIFHGAALTQRRHFWSTYVYMTKIRLVWLIHKCGYSVELYTVYTLDLGKRKFLRIHAKITILWEMTILKKNNYKFYIIICR